MLRTSPPSSRATRPIRGDPLHGVADPPVARRHATPSSTSATRCGRGGRRPARCSCSRATASTLLGGAGIGERQRDAWRKSATCWRATPGAAATPPRRCWPASRRARAAGVRRLEAGVHVEHLGRRAACSRRPASSASASRPGRASRLPNLPPAADPRRGALRAGAVGATRGCLLSSNCTHATVLRGGTPCCTTCRCASTQGEHTAILGPNGAGKTSLMRVLTLDDRPRTSDGDGPPPLRLLGRHSWDLTELRARFAVVTGDLDQRFGLEMSAAGCRGSTSPPRACSAATACSSTTTSRPRCASRAARRWRGWMRCTWPPSRSTRCRRASGGAC